MISENRIIQRIVHFISVMRLRLRSYRVSVILAARFLLERMVRHLVGLRRAATPARILLSACLVAGILAPTTLYFMERADRADGDLAYRKLFIDSRSESHMLLESVQSLLNQRAKLRSLLLEAGYPIYDDDGALMLKVLATGYSSSVIETDDTPYITAANTRTRTGIVALSRDLLKRYTPDAPFAFGDRIHISGLGEFTVEDSMHHRWRKRMDIWFPSRRQAFRFGKQSLYITKLAEGTDTGEEDPLAENSLQ